MSYARWGDDSDVYVYHSARSGGFSISVSEDEHYSEPTAERAIAKLLELRARGERVPDRCIERLRRDSALDLTTAAGQWESMYHDAIARAVRAERERDALLTWIGPAQENVDG